MFRNQNQLAHQHLLVFIKRKGHPRMDSLADLMIRPSAKSLLTVKHIQTGSMWIKLVRTHGHQQAVRTIPTLQQLMCPAGGSTITTNTLVEEWGVAESTTRRRHLITMDTKGDGAPRVASLMFQGSRFQTPYWQDRLYRHTRNKN